MPQTATFGAGCFWGIEDAFRKVPGVTDTEVGYTGGHTANPTYRDVCTDTTGHAEVVRVIFDPEVTNFETLLDLFWTIHDPTQLNRQGPDFGRQYRSAIFYHDEDTAQLAEASKARLDGSGKLPESRSLPRSFPKRRFTRAEEYHQKYFEKTGHRVAQFIEGRTNGGARRPLHLFRRSSSDMSIADIAAQKAVRSFTSRSPL